jgi:serpin B
MSDLERYCFYFEQIFVGQLELTMRMSSPISTSIVLCLLVCSGIQSAEIDVTGYANNATDFAMKLYGEIAKQPDASNIFFSPYSISTAMAMIYIGSKGDTKKQLADVLGYHTDMTSALSAAKEIQQRVFAEHDDYELDAANKLYLNKGYKVLEDYMDNLVTYFQAESDDVDFVTDPGEAREEINDWVAGKTRDNIKELFAEG